MRSPTSMLEPFSPFILEKTFTSQINSKDFQPRLEIQASSLFKADEDQAIIISHRPRRAFCCSSFSRAASSSSVSDFVLIIISRTWSFFPASFRVSAILVQDQGILFHIVLKQDKDLLYLSKFNDPFNYNRLHYVFDEDGMFNRKMCFATLKDAEDVKNESFVVAHKYPRKFIQRLRVESW
jgi:hypothetical protein